MLIPHCYLLQCSWIDPAIMPQGPSGMIENVSKYSVVILFGQLPATALMANRIPVVFCYLLQVGLRFLFYFIKPYESETTICSNRCLLTKDVWRAISYWNILLIESLSSCKGSSNTWRATAKIIKAPNQFHISNIAIIVQ